LKLIFWGLALLACLSSPSLGRAQDARGGLDFSQGVNTHRELDGVNTHRELDHKKLDIEKRPDNEIYLAARPNPFNRGNCFQWKKCLGETIGNMWIASPEFCGPLGGKSWKGQDGQCIDLLDVPWSSDPRNTPKSRP
jgi:hypothetical protein